MDKCISQQQIPRKRKIQESHALFCYTKGQTFCVHSARPRVALLWSRLPCFPFFVSSQSWSLPALLPPPRSRSRGGHVSRTCAGARSHPGCLQQAARSRRGWGKALPSQHACAGHCRAPTRCSETPRSSACHTQHCSPSTPPRTFTLTLGKQLKNLVCLSFFFIFVLYQLFIHYTALQGIFRDQTFRTPYPLQVHLTRDLFHRHSKKPPTIILSIIRCKGEKLRLCSQ